MFSSSPTAAAARAAQVTPQTVYYLAYPIILSVGWIITWVNTRRAEAVKGDIARVNEQLKEFYGPLASVAAATRAAYEAMIQEFLEHWRNQNPVPEDAGQDSSLANAEPKKAVESDELVAAKSSADELERVLFRNVGSISYEAWAQRKETEAATKLKAEAQSKWKQQKDAWHAALDESRQQFAQGQSPAEEHYRLWALDVLQPLNERALEILIRRADLTDNTAMPVVFGQLAAHVLAFRTLITRWKAGKFDRVRCSVSYPEGFGDYVDQEFCRLKLRQAKQLNTLQELQGTVGWSGIGSVEMKVSLKERHGVSLQQLSRL